MIQASLNRVLDGHDLSRDEAREAMSEIMRGETTPAPAAAATSAAAVEMLRVRAPSPPVPAVSTRSFRCG